MIQLAIKEIGFGEICTTDLDRKVQAIRMKPFCISEKYIIMHSYTFIIGTDQYKQLDKWYKINELKTCNLYCCE